MRDEWRKLSTRTIVSLTVSWVGWRIIGPSPTARVIREMGDTFSRSMEIAMARDSGAVDRSRLTLEMIMTIAPEYRTLQEDIRVKEHELMIAGHEFECEICIENNMTVHQKAIRAMRRYWRD